MTPAGLSEQVPGLVLAWDASRLASYMRDPLSFYWSNVLGWRQPGFKPKMEWGTFWHEATGYFEKRVFEGATRDQALVETIRLVVPAMLKAGFQLGGPGSNLKGDPAKRNVYTLVRALVWWEVEYRNNSYRTLALADGRPAIEFNFVLPLDLKAPTGEDYLLCGNIDRLVEDDDDMQFAVERKTTADTLSKFYFQRYDPSMQTYTYDLVCAMMFPNSRLRGVVVEACQTAVEFSRFDRHPIVRSPGARAHWLEVIKYWIKRAERDAVDNAWHYAINTECTTFDSVYKDIQRRDPKAWPALLKVDLQQEPLWNPLIPKPALLGG